jgi:hypothetical protein
MGNDKRPPGRRPVSILLAIAILAIIYWVGPRTDDVASEGEQTSSVTVDGFDTVEAGESPRQSPQAESSVPAATGTRTDSQRQQDERSSRGQPSAERKRDTGARAPPSGKPPGSLTRNSSNDSPQTSSSPSELDSSDSADLKYGLLREVGRQRYLSPAGLLYGPGSAEGHRLEHLRRHTKDDPRRSGSHGVFDGDMEGALATIDSAYERAKSGQRTTKEVDGDRTIYTVDLGKRIGYVGGSSGKRRGNPMARRVRLVVEGNYVVTAFPL